MNLYFRLFWVLLRGILARPRQAPLDVIETPFRVLPTDLDVNLHMNNGRYVTLMDLGRMDYLARTGMMGLWWRKRWAPVVGASFMVYRRPLGAFQRYVLRTRLSSWDEKWLYLVQDFVADGKVVARGYVRGLLRHGRRSVPPQEILDEIGMRIDAPDTDDRRFWKTTEGSI